jgi:RNA polymerase sigma factor (sigma-70 family)
LWQSLQKGEKIQNNKAFLFTITRRLIIDWYRKKKSLLLGNMKSEDGMEYDVPDETTVGTLDLGAEGRYLLDKMNELAPAHRDPIYLRFVEGLSPPEIGKVLGISANAASVRVNRGLSELRKKTGYNNDEKQYYGR